MAEGPAGGRPTTCPDCGGPVRPDREQLCPRCGYPLMFLQPESAPDGWGVARTPGEQVDDATALVRPAGTGPRPDPAMSEVPSAEPAAGEIRCSRCGQPNPVTRVRCQRCGQELRTWQPPARFAPPPPVAGPPWYRWLVVVGLLVLLVIAGLAAYLLAGGRL